MTERYVPNEAVAHREVEGQILLLLPGEHDLFTLNASGRLVWLCLIAGASEQDMADALVRQFGVTGEQARADVRSLIDALVAREIIAPVGEG